MIYHDRKSGLERAFRLLEEATKEKEEKLKEREPQFSPRMADLISNTFGNMTNSMARLEVIFKEGQEISKSAVRQFQTELDHHPWKTFGKVALGCFGAGWALGIYCRNLREKR